MRIDKSELEAAILETLGSADLNIGVSAITPEDAPNWRLSGNWRPQMTSSALVAKGSAGYAIEKVRESTASVIESFADDWRLLRQHFTSLPTLIRYLEKHPAAVLSSEAARRAILEFWPESTKPERDRLLAVMHQLASNHHKSANGTPKKGRRSRALPLDAVRFESEILKELQRIKKAHTAAVRRVRRKYSSALRKASDDVLAYDSESRDEDLAAINRARRDSLDALIAASFPPSKQAKPKQILHGPGAPGEIALKIRKLKYPDASLQPIRRTQKGRRFSR